MENLPHAKEPEISPQLLAKVLVTGDLSKISEQDRAEYMLSVCRSTGLNPLTKPFEFIILNSKLVMYTKRDATDQLRKIHGVSIESITTNLNDGIYIVTATARDKTGRTDTSTGVVDIENLKGDRLANAMLKCETKAKRRVTLSICGLGLLDETEVSDIPGAVQPAETPRNPVKDAKLIKELESIEYSVEETTNIHPTPSQFSLEAAMQRRPNDPDSVLSRYEEHLAKKTRLELDYVIPFGLSEGKRISKFSDIQLKNLLEKLIKTEMTAQESKLVNAIQLYLAAPTT